MKITYKFIFLALLPALLLCLPGMCAGLDWVSLKIPTEDDLRSVWGSSPTAIYAVGGHATTILLYDGMQWHNQEDELPETATADTYGVWGSSSKDVYTVGGWGYYGLPKGNILHHNSKKWKTLTKQPNSYRNEINELRGIWGTSRKDIYAVGERNFVLGYTWVGPLLHNKGSKFSEMPNPREYTADSTLFALWGSGPSDIYAVGTVLDEVCIDVDLICARKKRMCWEECTEYKNYNHTNIMHYDGTQWTLVETGVDADLYGIWGSAAQDVFAVGAAGSILHYDGSAWFLMNSGTDYDLRGIWGSAADDVFAVGDGGTILHYNGTAWSPMTSPTAEDLRGLWGAASDKIYAVGSNGTMLLYTQQMDFGDAPDPKYPTFFYHDGARHENTTLVWLGGSVDNEHDTRQVFSDNQTDEDLYDDGVEFLGSSPQPGGPYAMPFLPGQYGAVKVTVSGQPEKDCYLHAWIDWKANGNWDDPGENIICGYQCSAPGEYIIEFSVPKTISSECSWARFRLDLNDNLCSYKGFARYGEVEDYRLCPTLIELASLTAVPLDGKVVVEWVTASEVDNAGFNLYRSESENGSYRKINENLIPPEGAPNQGAAYSFTDTAVENGSTYYYLLEDIDNRATATMHGPVSATPDEAAVICYAMDDVTVKAGPPRYNVAESTGLETCNADIIFKNKGIKTVVVYRYLQDSYHDEKTGWYSATLAPGASHTSEEPAWGYVELPYDNMRTLVTTEVTAYYDDGVYAETCAEMGDIIVGGSMLSSVQTVNVEQLNPCRP